jgi:putative salt-induced outer membrane protein YdiY
MVSTVLQKELDVRMILTLCCVLMLALPLLAQTPSDAAAPAPPPDPWTGSIGAGLALTSGNSDTLNLNFSANTAWDPKTDRAFKAEMLYLRGETDGEKQVDKASAGARYGVLFSEKAFWYGEVQFLRDPFKAINYLVSPIVGAGYRVVKTDRHLLTVDGGAGAVVEDNDILGRDTSGALKAGETYEWTISPVSKATQKLTGLWKTNDFSDALYHFEAGLTTTVAASMELKVSYVYDYKNETPSPDIEKGDSALFAALLFKF